MTIALVLQYSNVAMVCLFNQIPNQINNLLKQIVICSKNSNLYKHIVNMIEQICLNKLAIYSNKLLICLHKLTILCI